MNSSGQSSSSCNSDNSSIKNSNVLLINSDFCFWEGIHLSITRKTKKLSTVIIKLLLQNLFGKHLLLKAKQEGLLRLKA